MEIEMFKIGQKIVCVDAKSTIHTKYSTADVLREGKTYNIQGLKMGCCQIEIHVGMQIAHDSEFTVCNNCGARTKNTTTDWYFLSSRFRPLEDNFAERALKEAIEGAKELEVLIETYQKETV